MQVWSKMDFDTGKVIFLDATRKEDMLQVEYPNGFLLDMGWYQDRYIISIIQNFIGRIQSSSMKQQKGISFPSC